MIFDANKGGARRGGLVNSCELSVNSWLLQSLSKQLLFSLYFSVEQIYYDSITVRKTRVKMRTVLQSMVASVENIKLILLATLRELLDKTQKTLCIKRAQKELTVYKN